MNLADYKNIWVFIETECGKPKNVGFELINAAKPLAQEKGCELIAVVIGVKPGKGNTFMRTKLKDVVDGYVLERRFNIGENWKMYV